MKRPILIPIMVSLCAALLASGAAPIRNLQTSLHREPKVRVLARGAPIHGSNGLAFGSNGRLYIASVGGREIVVMDPDSGQILDRIGTERGVESPDDLTFGADGSLYWTALYTGEVGKITPDGVKITVANLPPGANPITFSDDGRLFVALDFLGDALYEVDPNGVQPPRLIAENLGFLNGMDWGPDGYLYGPILQKGQVVRIDVNTGAITMVADGFGYPTAVKFDARGRLYVVDQLTGEMVRVNIRTGGKKTVSKLRPGLDNLAFDGRGHLFVSSAIDGNIWEVRPEGQARTVSRDGMIGPGGVAVLPQADGRETVFVADVPSLRGFDSRSGDLVYRERSIPGGSQIVWPLTVSPDGQNLVITSWFQNGVQVWDVAGHTVLENYSDFAVPLNAIRFMGDLVVAELGTGRVVRMDAEMKERTTLAQLAVPTGLAATDDDLWVGDWVSGSVFQVMRDGTLLTQPEPVATNLSSPEGLAVAPDGSLLVVESGAARLSRIDLATGSVTTIAEGLELGSQGPASVPPTNIFNGVAVSPSGVIYVTGDKENILYRIELRH